MKYGYARLACIAVLTLSLPFPLAAQQKQAGPYVPLDKHLDSLWVKSLFQPGTRKFYQGTELEKIAMPCAGIGAGQVDITGNGNLCFSESICNQEQPPNGGLGWNDGAQYLRPQVAGTKIPNGFAIRIRENGKPAAVYALDRSSFDDLQFNGEYPIATILYRSRENPLPVEIRSEVFSPFVPLSLRSSANPVTVVRFYISNSSDKLIDVSLAGWMQNGCIQQKGECKVNRVIRDSGLTALLMGTQPDFSDSRTADHQDQEKLMPYGNRSPSWGNMSLALMSDHAGVSLESGSASDYFRQSAPSATGKPEAIICDSAGQAGAAIGQDLRLGPGKTATVTFLIGWYFPNLFEPAVDGRPSLVTEPVGHVYNNWYHSAYDVVRYISANFSRLYRDTRLFHDSYFDNTLPYWLSSRISMPLSTLASGSISIWQNGRMFGYEGIGFCPGTTGHVYNFVSSIARLFPGLERSVRLMQDLCDSAGFSASGRINFRGHDGANPEAICSYGSDAQSGYVLKIYREHLMSSDNRFLDSVWPKVKYVIGYHIFRDGASCGLEPNGVLEGLQTFWDPMWYGPNPYNNTLYLAALRAAENMARIEGEKNLADRYHRIFEKGRTYMDAKMWNGEYYVHLYPVGFIGDYSWGEHCFASPTEDEQSARGYIDAFNRGDSNYLAGTGCDAQQLFGENWAQQLGLGYILPAGRCRIAANSIYKYNFTPDISTIYDYEKPKTRILAARGEAAMINGSWPKKRPQPFENNHDKTDIWTGLEYESACDMINEGLLQEGLALVRAVHDRYNGAKRNPWNEIEGSDHYVRAMQSWNLLLSLSGFRYDGPAGMIGFGPRMTAGDFRCFFSAAEGWGSYSQQRKGAVQQQTLSLSWGSLRLRELRFLVNGQNRAKSVRITLHGKPVACTYKMSDGHVIVFLSSPITLHAGEQLAVRIK